MSAISLETIDRIEITKGSGSVAYGDGATAGSIQIYTKPTDGIKASVSAGSYGVRSGSLSAGMAREMFDFTINASRYEQDGFSDPDVTGKKDKAVGESYSAVFNLYPAEWLELQLGVDSTDIDTRYPGYMTMAEFKDDPTQNGGNTYWGQEYETDSWNFGVKVEVMPGLELNWDFSSEDKYSNYYTPFSSESDYEYEAQRLTMKYTYGDLTLQVGADIFDGVRIGSNNKTHKDNQGYFIQGDYYVGETVFSAGVRKESVEYVYKPTPGASLKGDHNLTAWNLGLNHRYNDYLTVFSNINQAFQAPDIDRFFSSGGWGQPQVFNSFIDPAESRTLNIGTNLVLPNDKLKLALFYVDLKNEIYYYKTGPWTGMNTNIDESHKYGLELQETHRFND
ncbi:MAG: TonB-dependent receptor, partial [Gammaproteobacteria bacterium]|nr:TonB-dependent receptor [Gammaproteobacteria bacterium]